MPKRLGFPWKGCGYSSGRAGRVGMEGVTFTPGGDSQGHEGGASCSQQDPWHTHLLLPAMGIPLPAAGEASQTLEWLSCLLILTNFYKLLSEIVLASPMMCMFHLARTTEMCVTSFIINAECCWG